MDNKTTLIKINIDNGAAIKKIAELSKKITDNNSHVKELRKSIKELDKTSDDYATQVEAMNEEIAATNAQTTELKRTMGDLNRTVANTVRENMNNEGSLKSLRAELSRLTNEYDSLGKAQREGVEGADLQKRIADITDEIKGSEEATGRFYRNVGNYEDAIKNALGLNKGFASSIMVMAESMGGVNNIIPGLKGGIAGLSGALKALMANPIMLAIFGVTKIAEGFSFWFDYNKGLSEATRLTEQFTGLSGDALTSYRDEVQAVADVYGKEFKDVMQSANALAKQFGISYDEAINIIQDGFVAGADVSGNFLDTVKEYPTFFKEAGLSASEFVAISTEAAKSGVYSDKGVDAIKEATIRLREMTTSTEEALKGIGLSGAEIQEAMANGTMTAFDAIQLVSGKLNELPETSKEVGTAVADIFGGAGEDAGLQYLKTLKDILTDLDEVKDKAGEYAKVQDEYLQSEVELQKATNELFGGMSGSLDNLITQTKTFFNNVLAGTYKGILDAGYKIKASFASIGVYVDELGKRFKSMGEILKAVVTFQFDDVASAWDKWIAEVRDAGKKAGEAYAASYNESITKEVEATTSGSKAATPVLMPTKQTAETDLKEAKKAREKALEDLKKYEEELLRIIRDNTGTQIDIINAKYDAEIEELQKSFDANKSYAEDKIALESQTNEAIKLLNDKRNAEIAEANKQASDEALKRKADEWAKLNQEQAMERATELMQMELNGATELEILRAQEQQIREMLDALRREDYDSEAAFQNAKTDLELQASDTRKQIVQAEIDQNQEVANAVRGVFSSIGQLIEATSESEEEAARAGKAIALAEIAYSTGVAIAEGVSSAMSVPFPGNIVAIATTIATVLANIATAISTVKAAKFADGGLVTGPGTGTSDSIPALLSNGESVMTAETTSMFAPVLSAFNQIGGGAPISGQGNSVGEDMLERIFSRALSNMPSPIVDVQEITKVSNRVKVLENLSEA